MFAWLPLDKKKKSLCIPLYEFLATNTAVTDWESKRTSCTCSLFWQMSKRGRTYPLTMESTPQVILTVMCVLWLWVSKGRWTGSGRTDSSLPVAFGQHESALGIISLNIGEAVDKFLLKLWFKEMCSHSTVGEQMWRKPHTLNQNSSQQNNIWATVKHTDLRF